MQDATHHISPPESSPLKTLYGVPEGEDARALADLARDAMRDDALAVHVALDDTRLAALADLLSFFAPDVEIISFPAWDCLPYDRVSPNPEISGQRAAALSRLVEIQSEKARKPRLLLTTLNAATQRIPPVSVFKESVFSVKEGGVLDQDSLQSYLAANGYVRTQTVREAGEFAVRGGIIDLFPPGHEQPYRIDLFGDDIESVKHFDALTQLTTQKSKGFALQPVSELFLNDDTIKNFRGKYRELFGAVTGTDPLYEAVSAGHRYAGMEHWLPLFYDEMATLFDYVHVHSVTLDAQTPQAEAERNDQIDDFYQSRQTLLEAAKKDKKNKAALSAAYHPIAQDMLYLSEKEWADLQARYGSTLFSGFSCPDGADAQDRGARLGRDFADARAQAQMQQGSGATVFDDVRRHIVSLASDKVLIAAYSEGARQRLFGLLEQSGVAGLQMIDDAAAIKKLTKHDVGMIVLPLERGFEAPDLAVLTEQDILGDRIMRKAAKRRKADNFIQEISSLSEGDLVVHVDHGVGRFERLETLDVGGASHDFLRLVYSGDDKLFVPVENIEVLTRYGSEEGASSLDKLGGVGWQARKASVKKNLMAIADHLLGIAAARTLRKAEKLDVSEGVYDEFASRFPYQETEDQLNSINAVIGDMHKGMPMDRLVCGDVGFGKTEVAMRAAFVAAMSGVQVAIVAPTTLLVRQHYQNFLERFKGYGLRVEQLSRLVNARDSKKVKEGLADGSVNIVVGTHALFAKSLKFAHLGLLVVDEEQRFGVKQKERLKELKENIHVLTLTATPIPRTLQMSLAGVRELSLIATPPVDRLAVRTFALPYDPLVIREAIMREHYRGGQSFYVCPRIKDLPAIEAMLKELVPEVKVITAHGQMTPTELEDRMNAFYDGQYGILLATNIIESGIDIASANTLIMHRADMFGLAQLYQLRGRVGRSKLRAYAYLTWPADMKLTKQAQRRLEVIETLDTLGSGFQLASHDMDIRGAGNLLGDAQSGHIREVGVELYQHMLEEAVAAAREGAGDAETEEQWSPQLNLGTSVMIPESYVADLNLRLSLYRRISELSEKEEVEAFAAELIDRFGDIPEEVENLLKLVTLKQLCRQAGIEKIDAGPKGAIITFHNNQPPNVDGLLVWLADKAGSVKLRPDQTLALIRSWPQPHHRVIGVENTLKELVVL